MDVPGTPSMFRSIDNPLDTLLDKVQTGKAILFIGAGFSKGAKNIMDADPPTAKELSKMICKLGDFDEDDDLMFTSDYFIKNNNPDLLIDFLKQQYTIKSTAASHQIISGVNWRRVYTTNYDNTLAVAGGNHGKLFECISAETLPSEYYRKDNICVHINGSISNLTRQSLQSSFKLSASSYISPESFADSPWYYSFKKDLERSSTIVFIGYSMYDIDIQKILFAAPELKDKTFFVTAPSLTTKEAFTLSKFGSILPIGIDEFSNSLQKRSDNFKLDPQQPFYLGAFCEYTITENGNRISDNEIHSFLMHGILDSEYLTDACAGAQAKPYMINRAYINDCIELLKSNKYIVVTSSLGNGKSIFCNQLMAHLTLLNVKCYYLIDGDSDYIGDIERIAATNTHAILVVDAYEKHLDLVKFFATLNPPNIKLLLSSRIATHERLRREFFSKDNSVCEVNVDHLNQAELEQMVNIIDNAGYWGKEAHLSARSKAQRLKTACQSEISSILLYFFKSPQIENRISQLVNEACVTSSLKKSLFSICLLNALDLPLTPSLISIVSGVDDIYKSSLRDNDSFMQLYRIDKGSIKSKSSLFALYLLRHHFSFEFSCAMLLEIIDKFEKKQENGDEEKVIFRSLLRFTMLERIAPEKNKRSFLIKYYDEVKIRITWLLKSPHYWLQYAMARMMFSEYNLAEIYLDQATALANNKKNYDTSYIDNQKAKLYIMLSLEKTSQDDAFQLFYQAHSLLSTQANDVYKFRQVALYKDFFDKFYHSLSKKHKSQFETACRRMLKDLNSIYKTSAYIGSGDATINSCHEKLEAIITMIDR